MSGAEVAHRSSGTHPALHDVLSEFLCVVRRIAVGRARHELTLPRLFISLMTAEALPRPSPELPQPRQAVEMIGTRPHPPPCAVPFGAEPPTRPRRRFSAVRRPEGCGRTPSPNTGTAPAKKPGERSPGARHPAVHRPDRSEAVRLYRFRADRWSDRATLSDHAVKDDDEGPNALLRYWAVWGSVSSTFSSANRSGIPPKGRIHLWLLASMKLTSRSKFGIAAARSTSRSAIPPSCQERLSGVGPTRLVRDFQAIQRIRCGRSERT